ncbi:unnamed protein product (mitochondrion) [Plasmodiophora brassicae]|uniref:Uncharacterized protein n=1 Tax=Plasmodiophora brassicae TaxID=37360 RepID=A0A0G4J8G7_PLABS|nr:hypothetical protein PBRA_003413 [Plasmodiophora brassicae]SPQ99761.1 unnamed protein product [Plasmodiophora brassicae]
MMATASWALGAAALSMAAVLGAPVVMWSPMALLGARSVALPDLSPIDCECFLESLVTETQCTTSTYPLDLVTKGHVRALVLVTPQGPMHPAKVAQLAGSFSHEDASTMGPVLESAKTRVQINNVHIPATTFLTAYDGTPLISIATRQDAASFELSSSATFMSVIVSVTAPDLSTHDLRHIVNVVSEACDGNYAGVITALDTSESHMTWSMLKASDSSVQFGGSQPTDFLTWEILSGLIVAFMLLVILFLFFGLLADIETPLRFPRKPFDVSKEY